MCEVFRIEKEFLEMEEEMNQLGMTKLSEIEYNHIEELAASQLAEQGGKCNNMVDTVLPGRA